MSGPRARSVVLARNLVVDWTMRIVNGVPANLARDRFDQIVSDLWEQEHAATHRGPRLAASIVGRLLRGVPSDVAWRIGALAAARLPGVGRREASRRKQWVPLAAGPRPFDQTNGSVDFDVPPARDDRNVKLSLLEAGAAGSIMAQGFGGLGG